MDHLDNLIKLKDERINELQKQLDRKQLRRKDSEIVPPNNNSTSMLPFEEPPSPVIELIPNNASSKHSIKQSDSKQFDMKQCDNKPIDIKLSDYRQFDIKQSDNKQFDIKQSDNKQFETKQSDNKQLDIKHSDIKPSDIKHCDFKQMDIVKQIDSKPVEEVKEYKDFKEIMETFEIKDEYKDMKDSKLPSLKNSRNKLFLKPPYYPTQSKMDVNDTSNDIDRIKSDVFKEVEDTPDIEGVLDEVFKDSEQGMITSVEIGMPSLPTTIEDAIHKEVIELCKPIKRSMDNFMD